MLYASGYCLMRHDACQPPRVVADSAMLTSFPNTDQHTQSVWGCPACCLTKANPFGFAVYRGWKEAEDSLQVTHIWKGFRYTGKELNFEVMSKPTRSLGREPSR